MRGGKGNCSPDIIEKRKINEYFLNKITRFILFSLSPLCAFSINSNFNFFEDITHI